MDQPDELASCSRSCSNESSGEYIKSPSCAAVLPPSASTDGQSQRRNTLSSPYSATPLRDSILGIPYSIDRPEVKRTLLEIRRLSLIIGMSCRSHILLAGLFMYTFQQKLESKSYFLLYVQLGLTLGLLCELSPCLKAPSWWAFQYTTIGFLVANCINSIAFIAFLGQTWVQHSPLWTISFSFFTSTITVVTSRRFHEIIKQTSKPSNQDDIIITIMAALIVALVVPKLIPSTLDHSKRVLLVSCLVIVYLTIIHILAITSYLQFEYSMNQFIDDNIGERSSSKRKVALPQLHICMLVDKTLRQCNLSNMKLTESSSKSMSNQMTNSPHDNLSSDLAYFSEKLSPIHSETMDPILPEIYGFVEGLGLSLMFPAFLAYGLHSQMLGVIWLAARLVGTLINFPTADESHRLKSWAIATIVMTLAISTLYYLVVVKQLEHSLITLCVIATGFGSGMQCQILCQLPRDRKAVLVSEIFGRIMGTAFLFVLVASLGI